MSLSRKFLAGMGIEDKQIESIIEAHSDTVTALKNERDGYKEKAELVPDLQRQLEEAKADTSLKDLQARYDESEKAHKRELAALKKESDAAIARVSELEAANAELGAKLEEANASHQQELESKQAEFDAALAEANGAKDGIQAEFDSYKAEVDAREALQAKAKAYRTQILGAAGLAPNYLDDVMAVTKLDGIELDEDGNVANSEDLIEGVKTKWGNFIMKQKTEPAKVENPPAPSAGDKGIEGAHERALQIARERHERLYGKSEE